MMFLRMNERIFCLQIVESQKEMNMLTIYSADNVSSKGL